MKNAGQSRKAGAKKGRRIGFDWRALAQRVWHIGSAGDLTACCGDELRALRSGAGVSGNRPLDALVPLSHQQPGLFGLISRALSSSAGQFQCRAATSDRSPQLCRPALRQRRWRGSSQSRRPALVFASVRACSRCGRARRAIFDCPRLRPSALLSRSSLFGGLPTLRRIGKACTLVWSNRSDQKNEG